MSVLIKGMEMPKDCRECPMQTYSTKTGKTWCLPADEILEDGYRSIQFYERPDWCPLVEVKTPHCRLIDADAVMETFADRLEKVSERYGIGSAVAGAVSGAMKLLDAQQTVIETEGER